MGKYKTNVKIRFTKVCKIPNIFRDKPVIPSQCQNVSECERWRTELLIEISRNIQRIQDSI